MCAFKRFRMRAIECSRVGSCMKEKCVHLRDITPTVIENFFVAICIQKI